MRPRKAARKPLAATTTMLVRRQPLANLPTMTDRAVIFDMDGVLVLSGPAHWIAWAATAKEHGFDLSQAEYLAFNGMTNIDICQRLFGARATDSFTAQIGAQKERAYRSAIANAVPLAPGCHAVLASLQAEHLRMAVGTSGPLANLDLVLDGGAIRQFFGALVHADLVQRGKPAPDIFLSAAALLHIAPKHCVVIEDAPAGIRAAHAAGMRVIGLTTNHSEAELRDERAHTILPDLQSLTPALIHSLLR